MDNQFNELNLYIDDPGTEYFCSPLGCDISSGFNQLQKMILYNDKKNMYDEIKILIDTRPELINHQNGQGWTALMIACTNSRKYNTLGIIELLLKCPCININAQQCRGWTALMLAARNSNTFSNIETVRLLLGHPNTDIHLKQIDGHSALILAAIDINTDSKIEILELLLKDSRYMVTDSIIHDNGPTALSFVAGRICRNIQAVKLLLDNGVDVNYQPKYNKQTALMHSVTGDNSDDCVQVTDLLLKYGANCDLVDYQDKTALSYAIDYGFMKMVDLLCAHGASFEKTGYTIDMLEQQGKHDIIKIIQSYDIPSKGVVCDS